MIEIKVCGVSDEDTAAVAIDAGATHVGIVAGAPCSLRHVNADTAMRLVRFLRGKARSVLVTRTLTPGIIDLARDARPDLVQVHDPGSFHLLGELRGACSCAIMFGVHPGMDGDVASLLREQVSHGDVILVDGSLGTGKGIDEQALSTTMDRLNHELGVSLKDVFIAGGLSPENIETVLQAHSPRGVDASSGLETYPGVKDTARIRQFCTRIKNTCSQPE